MKKIDIFVFLGVLVVFSPFFLSEPVYEAYTAINHDYPLIMSFFKFAVLATFGETLGLRIREGRYNYKGFGLLPRALVWGLIGLTIKLAFVVFAAGVPVFLSKMFGFNEATQFSEMPTNIAKIGVALSISIAMNVIYAPVMMTMHKITDTHIMNNGGTLRGFFRRIPLAGITQNINWNVHWNFVFKKTIPYFWIPAHTVTFLLPPAFRVLFAAILGIMLGVILAVASLKGQNK